MKIIPERPLLALAVVILVAVSGNMVGEEFDTRHDQLQDEGDTRGEDMETGRRLELDPDRVSLFVESVNAELERHQIRGAAYAFRGPVSSKVDRPWDSSLSHCSCACTLLIETTLLSMATGNGRASVGAVWTGISQC
jgi:hypothetical protein